MTSTERFFAYARERHAIYLRRAAGQPRPWTDDPILRQYRFTNVFRELDKTTNWFRRNVRDPLRDRPEVLLATVLFRMLNRIEVGEAIFLQGSLQKSLGGKSHWNTAFDAYLDTGDMDYVRDAIKVMCGRGPYVTGAYIISTPPGKAKLDGALWIVDNFAKNSRWQLAAKNMMGGGEPHYLRSTFEWLGEFDYLGTFHSYEIVTDLRHTALLEKAPDIMTWANVGPGARRGLNRIYERRRDGRGRSGWGALISETQALREMQELLRMSRDARYWPQGHKRTKEGAKIAVEWPAWEMREVEHTLCEFDKMERVLNGEGRPRGRFS